MAGLESEYARRFAGVLGNVEMRNGLIRFTLWLVSRGLFNVRMLGAENVPARGPALLASNHVTYLDGFLIWFFVPCPVRFIAWEPFFRVPGIGWGLRFIRAIPVAGSGIRNMRETVRQARQQLLEGRVVCIFPEGTITRSGALQPFQRGMELIVHGLDIPIIPVYLGGMWGSIFSFEGGSPFCKWPRKLRYPATISFGKPMASHSGRADVRRAVEQLAEAAEGGRNASGPGADGLSAHR